MTPKARMLRVALAAALPDKASFPDWQLLQIAELEARNDPRIRRLVSDADYRQRLRARRRDAGKCQECEAPAVTISYCEAHRDAHARLMRRGRMVGAYSEIVY